MYEKGDILGLNLDILGFPKEIAKELFKFCC